MCVSPGEATGIVTRYVKGRNYGPSDIVILDEWITSSVAVMKDAGGLISTLGGLTSHASIIAREYKIPCLVGVQNSRELADGMRIRLDATNEEIHLL